MPTPLADRLPELTKPLADTFISIMLNSDSPVLVFLTNGVKLSGNITDQDQDAIILSRDGIRQLVFMRAIATIMPNNPS